VLHFNGNDRPSVGIELELQIVDSESNRLVPKANHILQKVQDDGYKKELFQSTIEITTTPETNFDKIAKQLRERLKALLAIGKKMNVGFFMGGTHPFTSWEEQKITASPRYLKMVEMIQWPARRMMIHGLHIHVGLPSGNEAIHIANKISAYIPHLLTLSASSPFWDNMYTGLASCRAKIFETLPTAGLPFQFKDWNDYVYFINKLQAAGSIGTYRDIWWDIRPHPEYGTLEIRIFDAVPTLTEVMALAALSQNLVTMLQNEYNETLASTSIIYPEWLLKENKWRAARYGMNGSFLLHKNSTTSPVKTEILALLDGVKDQAKVNKNTRYFKHNYDIVEKGPSYSRQLGWYNGDPGNLKNVVDLMRDELAQDL
jgi:carboxylate-amine ligase